MKRRTWFGLLLSSLKQWLIRINSSRYMPGTLLKADYKRHARPIKSRISFVCPYSESQRMSQLYLKIQLRKSSRDLDYRRVCKNCSGQFICRELIRHGRLADVREIALVASPKLEISRDFIFAYSERWMHQWTYNSVYVFSVLRMRIWYASSSIFVAFKIFLAT